MKLVASGSSWNCRCGNNHGKFACRVPPSPDVMAAMYMEYKRSADFNTKSFAQYLASIGFTDPSVGMVGMDDEAQFVADSLVGVYAATRRHDDAVPSG